MSIVAPSILSADFANLEKEIVSIENADMIHIDVMDGHFVPNISLGFPIIKSLRKVTDMFFDVHLMILNPEKYIDEFINCGSDNITVHIECLSDIQNTINYIKQKGKKVSLSLNPETPIELVFPYLDQIYMVLIMTVQPGFGGQPFIEKSLDKISTCKKEIQKKNLKTLIQVDGGITYQTAENAVKAGADVLVAGYFIFSNPNRKEAIKNFKKITGGSADGFVCTEY